MSEDRILENFPEMEEVYEKFYQSFDSQKNFGVEGAMESLLSSTKMHLQSILKKRNFKRAQNLADALQSAILHLHIRGTGTKKASCIKNANIKSESHRALLLNLLAQLTDLYLLLSESNKSFINQAVQALHLYTDNNIMDMICILLQCNLVKKCYSEMCQPLLRHVLYLAPSNTLLPKDYLRCLYLLRLWDKCTKDNLEKSEIHRLASKLKIVKSHAAQLKSDFLEIMAMVTSCREKASIDQKWIHTFFLRRKFPPNFLQQLRKVLCEDFAVISSQELVGGSFKDSIISDASNNMNFHAPIIEGHISFKSLSSDENILQPESSSLEFQKISNDENTQEIDDFPLFVIDTKREENVVSFDGISLETASATSKKSKHKENKLALVNIVDHTISAISSKASTSNIADGCHDFKIKHGKKKQKKGGSNGADGPSNEKGKNDEAVEGKGKKRGKRKRLTSDDVDDNAKSKEQELMSVNKTVAVSNLRTMTSDLGAENLLSIIPEYVESKHKGKFKNKRQKEKGVVADESKSKVKKIAKTSSSKKCDLELPCTENELKNEMDENCDVFDVNIQDIEEKNISLNSPENQQTLGKRGLKDEKLENNKKQKKKASTTVDDCVETIINLPSVDKDIALNSKFKKSSLTNKEYGSKILYDDYSDDSEKLMDKNKDTSDDAYITKITVETMPPTSTKIMPSTESGPEGKNLSKNKQKKKSHTLLVDGHTASSNLVNELQDSLSVKMECESNDGYVEMNKSQLNSALLDGKRSLEQLTSIEVDSAHTPNEESSSKAKKRKAASKNLSKALSNLKFEADEQSFPSSIAEENGVSEVCSKNLEESAIPDSSNQGLCSTQYVGNSSCIIFAHEEEPGMIPHLLENTSAHSNEIKNSLSPKKQAKRMLKSPAADEANAKEVKDTSCDINSEFGEFLPSSEVRIQEKTSFVYDLDASERETNIARNSDASESSSPFKIGESFSQRQCLNVDMAEDLSICPGTSPCKSNKISTSPCLSFSEQKHDLKENEYNEEKTMIFEVDEEPVVSAVKNNEAIPINRNMSPTHSDTVNSNQNQLKNSEELPSLLKNNSNSPSPELEKELNETTGSIVSDSSKENSFAFDDSSISFEINSSSLSNELEKELDIATDNALSNPSNKILPLKSNLNNSRGENNIEVIVSEDKMDEHQCLIEPLMYAPDSEKSICATVQVKDSTLKPHNLASPVKSKNNCDKGLSASSQGDDSHRLDINDNERDKELVNDSHLEHVILDQPLNIIKSLGAEHGVDLVENDPEVTTTCASSQFKIFKPIATISPIKINKLSKSTDNALPKAQESNIFNLLNSKKLVVRLQNCLSSKNLGDSKCCDAIEQTSLQLNCPCNNSVDPQISNLHLRNTNISYISPQLCHSSHIKEKTKTWVSNGLDFSNVGEMLSKSPQMVKEFPKPLTPSKCENKQRRSSSEIIDEEEEDDDVFHSPVTSDCESEIPETLEEKPIVAKIRKKIIKSSTESKSECETSDNCSLVDFSLKNMYLNSPSSKTRGTLPSEDCDCEIGTQFVRRSKRIRKLSSASDRSQSESEDDARPKPRKKIAMTMTLKKIPEASPQVNNLAVEKEKSGGARGYNLRTRRQLVAPSKLK